mgnify:CR=1 FL=1
MVSSSLSMTLFAAMTSCVRVRSVRPGVRGEEEGATNRAEWKGGGGR